MAKSKYTIPELKQLAVGRWQEILSSLGGCSLDILDGKHHPCPLCGGTNRFRMIDAAAGALFCNQCFSAKNGDGLAALQWLRSWTFREAAEQLAGYLGVQLDQRGRKRKGKGSADRRNPIFATLRDLIRITLAEINGSLIAKGISQTAQFAAHWKYETFVVLRINLPTPAGEKQRKTFRPCHPVELPDGRRAWRLGYPPGKRPLYRLAELQAATDTSLVVVVAGEKAADAAAGLGLLATTCAGGEKAVKETDWSPLARFDQVLVSIDNDLAGCDYGQAVARHLAAVCKTPAKVMELPDLPPRGDIVEWVAAGGTHEEFLRLAASEAAALPDPLAGDRKLCEVLHVDVLGWLPGNKIKVFSEDYGKSSVIDKNASQLTFPDALQMFGPIVREKIVPRVIHGDGPPPGMYTLDRLRDAIAVVGGAEPAGRETECGQGVWLGKPAEPHGPSPVVLVGAGQAAVWDGQRLEVVRRPRVAGLKLDLDASIEQQWYDPARLSEYLVKSQDRDWIDEAITEAGNLFALWPWRSKTQTIADLVTGLVLASWVQSAWIWRPLVTVIGATASGKSVFFESLAAIFGSLAFMPADTTGAGIRQNLGNRSAVILCDEFEKKPGESRRRREEILEMFRASSRGGLICRGTPGNQDGKTYRLRHIPWLAAITIDAERAADRNRCIGLALDTIPREKQLAFRSPSKESLGVLGQKLLALAIRSVGRAKEVALWLKSQDFPEIHVRVIESFATPMGALAAATNLTNEQAIGLMSDLFTNTEQDPTQATKDETDLLGEILGSLVNLGKGEQSTVGQLLANPTISSWDALARVGVAPIAKRPGQDGTQESYRAAVFFATREAQRYLVRQTKWESQSLHQILGRLPGAIRCQQRVAGHRPWGVSIPWPYLRDKFLEDPDADF